MTLYDKFINSNLDGRVWKIYEHSTRKLLCKDYGSLKAELIPLDDMLFVKAELKVDKFGLEYWRVSVS